MPWNFEDRYAVKFGSAELQLNMMHDNTSKCSSVFSAGLGLSTKFQPGKEDWTDAQHLQLDNMIAMKHGAAWLIQKKLSDTDCPPMCP